MEVLDEMKPEWRRLLTLCWESLMQTHQHMEALGELCSEALVKMSYTFSSPDAKEAIQSQADLAGNNLESILLKIEHGINEACKTRDQMRHNINLLSRPFLRCLSILDLPNEILHQIFQYLVPQEEQLRYPPKVLYKPVSRRPLDNQDIKNCRLVCRRFSDLSSRFLIHTIRLTLDEISLARLDEISRHPTISKGVNEIKVVLDFFNDAHRDYRSFISRVAGVLRTTTENFRFQSGCFSAGMGVAGDRSEIQGYEKKLSTASSMERILLQMLSTNGSDVPLQDRYGHGGDKEYAQELADRQAWTIGKHREVLALMEAQKSLINGGRYFQGVLSALSRMPHVRSLSFSDNDPAGVAYDLMGIFSPDREPWDVVSERMLQPGNWDRTVAPEWVIDYGCPLAATPDFDCITGVIDAVCKAGVFLDTLKINVAKYTHAFTTPSFDAELRHRISHGMKKLRDFQFCCYFWEFPVFPSVIPGLYQELLAACLDTSSVQKISLILGGNSVPLRRVLGRRARPNLTHLYLENLGISDMENLLQRLPQDLEWLWLYNVRLTRSTWEEALDSLKDRSRGIPWSNTRRNNGLGHVVLYRPVGAECDVMGRRRYERMFGTTLWEGAKVLKPALAQLYIDRDDSVTSNPLGELEIDDDEGSEDDFSEDMEDDFDEDMGDDSEEDL
ncbi:hypothetical protein V8F20_001331 [Naviculisporaceae sp. PSN 640]